MECEEARKILARTILTTKKAFDRDPKIVQALEHLQKCDSCFSWSFIESQTMKEQDFIKYIKESGTRIEEKQGFSTDFGKVPRMMLGAYLINNSKARCYIAELSGYLIVYVEETEKKRG